MPHTPNRAHKIPKKITAPAKCPLRASTSASEIANFTKNPFRITSNPDKSTKYPSRPMISHGASHDFPRRGAVLSVQGSVWVRTPPIPVLWDGTARKPARRNAGCHIPVSKVSARWDSDHRASRRSLSLGLNVATPLETQRNIAIPCRHAYSQRARKFDSALLWAARAGVSVCFAAKADKDK